jgi:hypothetical protein
MGGTNSGAIASDRSNHGIASAGRPVSASSHPVMELDAGDRGSSSIALPASSEYDPLDATMDEGSPDWSVFDREGRYLGVVRMPDRFKPMVFRGDEIYGVWRDDLDVQYVLRLRILGMTDPD